MTALYLIVLRAALAVGAFAGLVLSPHRARHPYG